MFYWYCFEDGYRCCVRGLDKTELYHETRKHGKLLRKVAA